MATMSTTARFGFGRSRPTAQVRAGSMNDDAFVAARRHTRRVRFLRRAIPWFCAGMVALPVVWSFVAPLATTAAGVSVGAVSVQGTRIRMDAPKLSGFKKDQRGYEVTARDAVQDIRSPGVVELNKVDGRMEQEANSFARVTAEWGRFDQSADRLDLEGDVRVRTDKGYEADLKSARVDVKSGDIVSQEAVEVRSKSGTINADAMTIRDNGRHAVFEGRVRSMFVPEEEAPAASATETKAP
jgi:lipopolysaccharide export system protein LptC